MTTPAALDLLAIGETVIDMISQETAETLSAATTFERHLGGSPANLAVTVARLGGRAGLASKVGGGAFGLFAKAELASHGVVTDYVRSDPAVHTTVIFVARTPGTPDFQVFRAGDAQLRPDEIPSEAIERASAVHASAFALSQEPCRSAVLHTLSSAAALGKIVSIDPNYHPQIWPDREEALAVLGELYRHVSITKPSLDDCERLFGPRQRPEEYLELFHELGPRTVVLTLGRRGTLISDAGQVALVEPRMVDVVDATGAGDSFWGGFLLALIDGHTPLQAAYIAREVVALKLAQVGPLTLNIDRAELYARALATTPSPQPLSRGSGEGLG